MQPQSRRAAPALGNFDCPTSLLPPDHPAFRSFVVDVREAVSMFGPRAAADLCDSTASTVDTLYAKAMRLDAEVSDRIDAAAVDPFDLDDLRQWLRLRAREFRHAIS